MTTPDTEKPRSGVLRWTLIAIALLAVAGLWVRSYWRADALVFFLPSGAGQVVGTYNGRLVIALTSGSWGPGRALSLRHLSAPAVDGEGLADEFIDEMPVPRRFLGCAVASGPQVPPSPTPTTPGEWALLQVHLAFPVGVAVLILARLAVRDWRRWRDWRRLGHCRVCGYDLRESPVRCPECGTPVAA